MLWIFISLRGISDLPHLASGSNFAFSKGGSEAQAGEAEEEEEEEDGEEEEDADEEDGATEEGKN